MKWFFLLVLGVFVYGAAHGTNTGLGFKIGTLSLDRPSNDFITENCGTDAKFGTGIALDIEVEQSWKSIEFEDFGTLNFNYSFELGYWQAKASDSLNSVTFKVIPTIAYGKARMDIQKVPLSPYLRLGFDVPYFMTSWKFPVNDKKNINEFGFGLDAGIGLSYKFSPTLWFDFSITRTACFVISEDYEDLGAAGTKFSLGVITLK